MFKIFKKKEKKAEKKGSSFLSNYRLSTNKFDGSTISMDTLLDATDLDDRELPAHILQNLEASGSDNKNIIRISSRSSRAPSYNSMGYFEQFHGNKERKKNDTDTKRRSSYIDDIFDQLSDTSLRKKRTLTQSRQSMKSRRSTTFSNKKMFEGSRSRSTDSSNRSNHSKSLTNIKSTDNHKAVTSKKGKSIPKPPKHELKELSEKKQKKKMAKLLKSYRAVEPERDLSIIMRHKRALHFNSSTFNSFVSTPGTSQGSDKKSKHKVKHKPRHPRSKSKSKHKKHKSKSRPRSKSMKDVSSKSLLTKNRDNALKPQRHTQNSAKRRSTRAKSVYSKSSDSSDNLDQASRRSSFHSTQQSLLSEFMNLDDYDDMSTNVSEIHQKTTIKNSIPLMAQQKLLKKPDSIANQQSIIIEEVIEIPNIVESDVEQEQSAVKIIMEDSATLRKVDATDPDEMPSTSKKDKLSVTENEPEEIEAMINLEEIPIQEINTETTTEDSDDDREILLHSVNTLHNVNDHSIASVNSGRDTLSFGNLYKSYTKCHKCQRNKLPSLELESKPASEDISFVESLSELLDEHERIQFQENVEDVSEKFEFLLTYIIPSPALAKLSNKFYDNDTGTFYRSKRTLIFNWNFIDQPDTFSFVLENYERQKLRYYKTYEFEINETIYLYLQKCTIPLELYLLDESGHQLMLGKAELKLARPLRKVGRIVDFRLEINNRDLCLCSKDVHSELYGILYCKCLFKGNVENYKKCIPKVPKVDVIPAIGNGSFHSILQNTIKSRGSDVNLMFADVTDSEMAAFQDGLNLVLVRNKALRTTQTEISNELKERTTWMHEELKWRLTLQEHAILSGKDPNLVKWRQWKDETTAKVKYRPLSNEDFMETSQAEVEITVIDLTIYQESIISTNDNINYIYVEYMFLHHFGRQLETQSMRKDDENPMVYDFTNKFIIRKDDKEAKLMAEMIKNNETIPFTIVNEPIENYEEIQACQEIGSCYINIFDIIQTHQDVVEDSYPVIDEVQRTGEVGKLRVRFKGLASMRSLALIMLTPDTFKILR